MYSLFANFGPAFSTQELVLHFHHTPASSYSFTLKFFAISVLQTV